MCVFFSRLLFYSFPQPLSYLVCSICYYRFQSSRPYKACFGCPLFPFSPLTRLYDSPFFFFFPPPPPTSVHCCSIIFKWHLANASGIPRILYAGSPSRKKLFCVICFTDPGTCSLSGRPFSWLGGDNKLLRQTSAGFCLPISLSPCALFFPLLPPPWVHANALVIMEIDPGHARRRQHSSGLPAICTDDFGPSKKSEFSPTLSSSIAMSIPGSSSPYGDVPPPLPPPKYPPIEGLPYINESRELRRHEPQDSFVDDRENYKMRDRPFNRHEPDEGYHSIGSARYVPY